MKHPNSKKITIHRSFGYTSRSEQDMKELSQGSSSSIGSYFKNKTSTRPASGLDDWELDLLMPTILGIQKSHHDYNKLLTEYFKRLSVRVPINGLDLEVGLTENNNKSLRFKNSNDEMVDNLPLDIEDYIKYRFCLKHPKVGESKNLSLSNPILKWYIHDYETDTSTKLIKHDLEKQAMIAYYQISDNEDKLNMYLTLSGKFIKSSMKKEDKVLMLEKIVKNNPELFINRVNDKNSQSKYFITELVNYDILKTIGTRYLLAEDNTEIGSSIDEAVLNLRDKKNAKLLKALKIKLSEIKN